MDNENLFLALFVHSYSNLLWRTYEIRVHSRSRIKAGNAKDWQYTFAPLIDKIFNNKTLLEKPYSGRGQHACSTSANMFALLASFGQCL